MYQTGAVRRAGDDYCADGIEAMRRDAAFIIEKTIEDVLPMKAVRETIAKLELNKPVYVIAIGKAAWGMADEAARLLNGRIAEGIVVTKYGHSKGNIEGFRILESAHPFPDENSVIAAREVLGLADKVTEKEDVLLLLSGGGSSLVEMPAPGLSLAEVKKLTEILLKCGANIVEINTVRKHLSAIKGGKLAKHLMPARGYAIILSDVVGNHPEMIASGMTYLDDTSAPEVMEVIKKYHLDVGDNVLRVLEKSQATLVNNITNIVKGNVEELCRAAAKHADEAGYTPYVVAEDVECEAGVLGNWFSSMARSILDKKEGVKLPCAIIAGGETVVKVNGTGLGGRNQEIALWAAAGIQGLENIVLFSLASDGTDGPTDAAGGIVDGETVKKLREKRLDIQAVLAENDSYHALEKIGGLILTGPTGTNVNDVTVMLIK